MGPLQGVAVVEMAGIGPISYAGMMLGARLGTSVGAKFEAAVDDVRGLGFGGRWEIHRSQASALSRRRSASVCVTPESWTASLRSASSLSRKNKGEVLL